MKDQFIKFRATEEERRRWQEALAEDGRTLSEVCRATLDRLAKRAERKRKGAA
jgi:hypothetical protein